MEIKINNSVNFGWDEPTHTTITAFAIERNFPKLDEKYKKIFIEASKLPDKDENGLGNKHFYSLKEDKSFMDFRRKSNAKYCFTFHVDEMHQALEKGNMKLFYEHAGRALHFLQDLTQSMHAFVASIFSKFLDLWNHIKFEQRINKLINKIIEVYCKIYPEPPKLPEKFDIKDLLIKNAELSSNFGLPIKKNKLSWDMVGTKGICQALYSSEIFVKGVVESVNSSQKVPSRPNKLEKIIHTRLIGQLPVKLKTAMKTV